MLSLIEVVFDKKKSQLKIKEIKTDNLNYLVFINYFIEKICDKNRKS